MIGICGYNLCHDSNALDLMPTDLNKIESTRISNGIWDEFNITSNVTYSYSTTIPQFDFDTIMDCKFEDNVRGGNVAISLDSLNKIRFKKRKYGTNDWINVGDDININSYEDLTININDYYCASDTRYEYALVPIINNIEGNYIVNEITPKFNGIFICDVDSVYKLYSGVAYSNKVSNTNKGMIQTIGRKYPIIVQNSVVEYKSGKVSGNLFPREYYETRKISRIGNVNFEQEFYDFLNNGNSKIIKDWNGNIWLVQILGDSYSTYDSNYGMGIITVNFNWVEQGNYLNQEDMEENGMY